MLLNNDYADMNDIKAAVKGEFKDIGITQPQIRKIESFLKRDEGKTLTFITYPLDLNWNCFSF